MATPRFDVPDKFNKDKAFTRVKFGRDATLLDIELDEMQKIPQYKLEKAISNIVVDGFVNNTVMTLTGGTLTVPVDTVYLQGKTIEILEPMTLAGLTTADKVYLSVWEEVVDFDDVIKKGGNNSGGTTISNTDIIDAEFGEESTRRVQQKVQLLKVNTDVTKQHLLLATLTGATTFTDNRVKINVNIDVLPSKVLQDVNNRFMTDTERAKLSGVATGANLYVHPATHPASIIVQDATNRFMTDAERTKLAGVATGATNYTHPANHPPSIITQDTNNRFVADSKIAIWDAKETPTGAQEKADLAETNSKSYTDTKVSALVSSAPAVLDTLDELAQALGDDPQFAVTMTNLIGTKETPAGADAKVTAHQNILTIHTTPAEKASWDSKASTAVVTTSVNGLMIASDKAKIDGVAIGANNYVHPASHPPSIITQDSSNRFSSDTEKAVWNAKAPTTAVTTTVNGLMIFEDKAKLDGIATGANNYVHPANHSPSVITQDSSNRFVTDVQITAWDAKATTALATASVSGLMPNTDKAKLDSFTVVSTASANAVLKLDANSKLPASITGNADGNSATATKLFTPRAIAISGDGTGTVNFDGTTGVTIPLVLKNSGVVAGTHTKVTVDSKGIVTAGTPLVAGDIPSLDYSKITTGKPTTVAGYGLTDVSPTTKISATLPAIAGWYRIATSWLGIDRNAGRFEIDWSLSAVHGQVNFNAGIMYGVDPTINQTFFSTFEGTKGITKCRIVYHVTYTGNYAYLEVYNASASAVALNIQLASSIGWALMTPIAGSIPSGYSNAELTFKDGIVTDTQLVSQVATGIAPIAVNSTTVVPNLNVDMLDGSHAGTGANNVLKLDASGKASPSIIAQDVNNRFSTDAEKANWNSAEADAIAWAKSYGLGNNAVAFPTTNLNDITSLSGFYNGSSLTNAPAGSAGWFFVIHIRHANDTGYISQMAFPFGTSAIYVRSCNAGTWSAWVEMESTTGAQAKATLAETNAKNASAPIAHVGTGGTSHLAVTTSVNGFMISTDKSKLDGIATGANNYVHPTGAGNNHVPTGGATNNYLKYSASGVAIWAVIDAANILEDTTHKFATDAEKVTWNAKETPAGAKLQIEQDSYKTTKLTKDANGIFTVVEHRRKSDNLLVRKSTLSGGTSPLYTTRTVIFYLANGTTVAKTDVFTITYDADGDMISEV